ncbi:MAG: ABC transporter ATP-binding protein/permease, partial [Acidimicrobiia bacterium]|nr:ABC transporter ATP-binding protein/permease [Acidimicrobiia bacterium]
MMWARFGSDDQVERPLALLRRAAREGRDLRAAAIGALVAAVAATGARLLGPLLVRSGVDDGILAGDGGVVARVSLLYIGLFLVQYAASRWSLLAVTSVGERFLRRMRVRVYRHLVNLDIGYFGRTKAGVLVSRMTSDVEALTAFANEGAIAVITSTLTVIGVGVGLFYSDPGLAGYVLGVFPVLVIASVVFRRFADRAYRAVREQIGLVLGSLQEGITGVRVVQAYTQERGQLGQFHRVNQKYFDANLAAARAISTYFPVVDFLRTASSAMVLFVGGSRVLDGSMTFGSLVAFLLYLNWFFEPIVQLSNVYNLLQGALAALSKLFGILDRRPAVSDPDHPVEPEMPMKGSLEFAGVRFGYDPDSPVLDGLDLSIPAGQRVAVVGETGAGKSTVAKLAVRFYDPQAGRVMIDGIDLRDLAVAVLRRNVAMVPQEGFLFDGSIRDNIAYARADMSDEQVWEVCARLGIDVWVRSLPERLDTQVRERGSRLSSGERQLVSLARALAADPAVIVLDEATSNLDPETEAAVERALAVLLAGRTSIVIAHRLQTAERADRVLVVDRGRVVED